MASTNRLENEMVMRFREMFRDRNRKLYVVVVCLLCDSGVGIANRLRCAQGKLKLDRHEVKLGITICYGCGMRTRFGRMYSMTDHTRIMNKDVFKRLTELVNRSNSTIEILDHMVYLKPIVNDITCEIFSLTWNTRPNTGLNVRACIYSDMIRS
jgi:hypothetical protein